MSHISKYYELARHHELAGQSYDADLPEDAGNGINHEMVRLEKYAPVEYAITKRYLLRYIPGGATAADVGVGVGHYSELLASRGSKVHLVDVASGLLVAAQERLVKAGLGGQILSITDLSFIADDSCGAVLLLGPFYNLSLPEERRIRSRGSFGTSTTSYGSSLPNYGTTHRANGDRGRQRRGKIRSSHRMRPPLAKPPRV
jgi:Methyltransferase domain